LEAENQEMAYIYKPNSVIPL